jgi:hypothetical protein
MERKRKSEREKKKRRQKGSHNEWARCQEREGERQTLSDSQTWQGLREGSQGSQEVTWETGES